MHQAMKHHFVRSYSSLALRRQKLHIGECGMIGKWMDFLARTEVIRLSYQLITSTCAALSFITIYRRSPDLHLRTNPENTCLRWNGHGFVASTRNNGFSYQESAGYSFALHFLHHTIVLAKRQDHNRTDNSGVMLCLCRWPPCQCRSTKLAVYRRATANVAWIKSDVAWPSLACRRKTRASARTRHEAFTTLSQRRTALDFERQYHLRIWWL